MLDLPTFPPPVAAVAPPLPDARGRLSEHVLGALSGPLRRLSSPPRPDDDPLWGDDSAMALYALYELHYRGFAGVDEDWEWEPSLLRTRGVLERAFLHRLTQVAPWRRVRPPAVAHELVRLVNRSGGPSLSGTCLEEGTLEQLRELAIHRSAYQLKEADPHTFAIPRLCGPAKSAMVDIQMDEYGGGVAGRTHAELFAVTMRALGLDDRYGHYLDRLPGTTLATVNLVSMFGLHRRWRGALVGHLAYFEMCSVTPMGRYATALRRLGVDPQGIEFYREHVNADARHERVALHELAGGFVATEPALASDVVFGAEALRALEDAFARRVLDSWSLERSSLLP